MVIYGGTMSRIVTLIETILYIFIYVVLCVAFLSVIYDPKWLSILDKPSFKIIFGIYLAWLGFFSLRITRRFIEHDIMSAFFPIESIISITWGGAEYFEFIPRSSFFSTPSGAVILLVSLFIPYYYGNLHKSIFGGWKEKRKKII